jgi:hypothetical protein
VAHHAKSTISVRVATPEDLIALTKAGVDVEEVGTTSSTEGGAAE